MFDTIMNFLKVKSEIFNGFTLPNWVIAIVLAVIWIGLILLIVFSAVKKKNKSTEEPVAETSSDEAETEPEPAEETAVEETAKEEAKEEEPAKKEEPIEEAAPVEEPVEEPTEEVAIEEEPAEEPVKEEPVAEPVKEEVAAEEAPIEEAAEEPVAEEVKAEPVEEPVKEEKPVKKAPAKKAPAKEPAKKAPAKPVEKAPVKEEVKEESADDDRRKNRYAGKGTDSVFGGGIVEETVTYKKPAKKEEEPMIKKTATKAAPVKKEAVEKTAKKTPAKKPEPKKEEAKSAATGKFEICNSIGGFRYLLSANNGQLLYESRDYKSFDSCSEAIDKFVAAVVAGNFRVRGDKFGNYKFHLKSNTSNNIVYEGESYSTKKACENAVGSVQRFAVGAKIVDITEADYVAPASAFEVPADVKKEVAAGKGAVGKWEIALAETDSDSSPYVFLLYANNGQLLYESRDYKTADNCKSGLDTFVKTLKEGKFIIDSDKFGRYRFILRKAGNQVEYLGQNYSDKAACTRSAISVYKFGLLTPVE